MVIQSILFLVGLVALYFGAEWLVKGAGRLARAHGVSALVVGLTVVAAGTSAPEMVVTVLAALRGQSDVAMGNVVGSNIANVGLVLGLAAVIRPLVVGMALIRREAPIMVGASVLLLVFARDGLIARWEAAVLLVAFVAYILLTIRLARREPPAVEREYADNEDARGIVPEAAPAWRNVALIAAGLCVLVAGAQLLVGSALYFARALGVPELIVGVTVVAIGTSLPEIAASLVAAFRGEAEIVLGNVVGSNIFNVLLILGAAALAAPVSVAPALLAFEIPVMIGAAVLVLPLIYTGRRVERWEGMVLVAGYVAFTVALLW
jgi:cation:H+ antiporter